MEKNNYVSESEITDKISEITLLSDELGLYVEEFTAYVAEIQELLIGLKVCLNTTGGVARLKELSNIEFDTTSINSIASKIEGIQVTYNKVKEDINNVVYWW